MRLNPFLWNTFVESGRGREWLAFFSDLASKYQKGDETLIRFISDWGSHGVLEDRLDIKAEVDGVLDALKELKQASCDGLIPQTVRSPDEAEALFKEIGILVADAPDEDGQDVDSFYADDIPRLSVALYCLHPKFFFPYFFYPNFQALQRIFDEFGIFLPPVPPKREYEARFHYYFELCRSLHGYWNGLGLLPEQIPAFLYGFAPEVMELRHRQIKELPKPQRAWFLGAGTKNGDATYLDNVNESSQTFWTGHKDTEVGDIVIIYCLAPRSCIHSIWRAIQPGGIEPFRSYYSTMWMGNPVRVQSLSFAEMAADPILSEMPLIRAKMQGINGRNIPKKYYDRILLLLKNKGVPTETLPQLADTEVRSLRLTTERDIEVQLLEPLLHELGFKVGDWERQVKLQVGRTERAIPDYLIHPVRDKLNKSVRASWVWEAKFSVASHQQLQKDFGQVASYANLVGALGVGLISKEGIWIGLRQDDFSLKKARHWSAVQILEIDHLNDIRSIAGKRSVRSNG